MAWILLFPFAIVIGLYLRSLQQQQARKKKIARVMRQHRATQLKRQHRLASVPDRQLPPKIRKSKFFHSPNANSQRVHEIAKELRQTYPAKSEAWIWEKSRQIVIRQRMAAQSQVKPLKRANPDEHLKAPYRHLVKVLGDKKAAEELVVSRIRRNRELSLESAIGEALGLVNQSIP